MTADAREVAAEVLRERQRDVWRLGDPLDPLASLTTTLLIDKAGVLIDALYEAGMEIVLAGRVVLTEQPCERCDGLGTWSRIASAVRLTSRCNHCKGSGTVLRDFEGVRYTKEQK